MTNQKSFRPSWDHYFMAMAHMVAERSTCERLRGGAVLVKDKRMIATGYNGAPSGMAHCDDVGHLMERGHCIRTLHAEENTILQAAKFGLSTVDSTLYSTFAPCYHCLKKLIASGVRRVVGNGIYRDLSAVDLGREAGLVLELYEPDPAWLDYLSRLYGSLPRVKVQEIKTVPPEERTERDGNRKP